MTTFTIDNDYSIGTFGPGEEIPAGDGVRRFTSAKQLDQIAIDLRWTGDQLVEIWNGFAGAPPFQDLKPVKKFTDRKTAVARIWKAIQRLAPVTGAVTAAPQAAQDAPEAAAATKEATPKKKAARVPKGAKEAKPKKAAPKKEAVTAREGSKKAQVLELIRRAQGATIREIRDVTGWQAHSVRGYISGMLGKKMGLKVESFKRESGDRAYRLAQ